MTVLCEKLLSFAGPLLLYAEEIDATTGQHLCRTTQRAGLGEINALDRLSVPPGFI
jgi:alpha,alpha-trehalase